MSISRWDPFREMLSLREAMNQLLEESYVRPGPTAGAGAQGAAQALALDVADRGDAYEVTASLPGVRPEDIHCAVQGDTLTIRGESKAEQERREGNYLLRERRSGVMQRTVSLPAPIEADAVEADYQDGVLTLRLPKSRASMPRRIDVRTSGRPASLEAQTPGLDREQEQQTLRDAQAYYGQQAEGQGQQGQGEGQAGGQGGATPQQRRG